MALPVDGGVGGGPTGDGQSRQWVLFHTIQKHLRISVPLELICQLSPLCLLESTLFLVYAHGCWPRMIRPLTSLDSWIMAGLCPTLGRHQLETERQAGKEVGWLFPTSSLPRPWGPSSRAPALPGSRDTVPAVLMASHCGQLLGIFPALVPSIFSSVNNFFDVSSLNRTLVPQSHLRGSDSPGLGQGPRSYIFINPSWWFYCIDEDPCIRHILGNAGTSKNNAKTILIIGQVLHSLHTSVSFSWQLWEPDDIIIPVLQVK